MYNVIGLSRYVIVRRNTIDGDKPRNQTLLFTKVVDISGR